VHSCATVPLQCALGARTHIQTNLTQWVAPIDEVLMTLDQVQDAVDAANSDDTRWQRAVAQQDKIVALQARIRGALVRKAFRARLDFLNAQEASAIKVAAPSSPNLS
jgi:hypothetical protein